MKTINKTVKKLPLRTVELDTNDFGTHTLYKSGWQWCALVKPRGEPLKQLTSWSTCKDFLNELMWSQHSQIPTSIGPGYDPVKTPYDIRNFIRIGIKLNQSDAEDRARSSLKVIRAVEESLGIEKKCVLKRLKPVGKDKSFNDSIFYYRASNYWLKAPPLSSLFMTIVRGCRKYDPKEHGKDPLKFLESPRLWGTGNDIGYMQSVVDNKLLRPLITKGHRLFFPIVKDNYNIKCDMCGNHIPKNDCCKNHRYSGLHSYGLQSWAIWDKADFKFYIYKGVDLYKKKTAL
jgi:hypothetical protein